MNTTKYIMRAKMDRLVEYHGNLKIKKMYSQASENLFHWFHSSDGAESRPAMIAPDPFALPKPDPTEESDYHLPLGTI